LNEAAVPTESVQLPVISLAPLVNGAGDVAETASSLSQACRESGFFYVVDHGIDLALFERLESLCRRFFALPHEQKMRLRMELAGRAWRGYFPVGAELTSGLPDQKEGLYFGSELSDNHPKVAARIPLHGANLFPDLGGFRETVLAYLDQMTRLGHTLMRGLALGLDLEASYFADRYTTDPLILFRVFHYPPLPTTSPEETTWSVGEHTDYGLLTMLRQDEIGGLQIKSGGRWIDAPPIENSFVCNIGDMLERMTGGLFRSTPHRVRNRSSRGRLSFPFFFDPNWDAEIQPIRTPETAGASARWDGENVFDFSGTYGEYILRKVSRVFPDLDRNG
jgi:isopenicillin N synthase-like dioxygenase